MKYLLSTNMDAVLEVFRVFANLSREQSIRNYLVNRKGKRISNFNEGLKFEQKKLLKYQIELDKLRNFETY